MTLRAKLKFLFSRDTTNLLSVREFGHANRDLLVIVADPKTDRIFATYRDRFVNGTIKAVSGRKARVVKDVLKYSQFDKSIDGFLASIMETLQLPIMRGQDFYKFLDGALFSIAKSLRKKREAPAIKSPFIEPINH